MSNSTMSLCDETKPLTTHAKNLNIQGMAPSRPQPWFHYGGSRNLALSPYRRATRFFVDWEEENETSSPGQRLPSEPSEDQCSTVENSIESDPKLPNSSIEDEEENLEIARCRVLGILKCYLFNLEHGTLNAGDDIDVRVLAALRRIIALSEGCDLPNGEVRDAGDGCGGDNDAEIVELSRSIDEPGLVAGMVDDYIGQLAGSCREVCGHVAGLAKDILSVGARSEKTRSEEITADEFDSSRSSLFDITLSRLSGPISVKHVP
ncbi:unnamed protein product [Diplocarpon coronariae]